MTVLAIDPGRGAKATIGFCLFDGDGRHVQRGELTWDELVEYYYIDPMSGNLSFRGASVTRVVCEDFVNDPRVKRGGQRNGASEVIGALEFLAQQAGVEFIRRDRSTLTAAKMHAGYTQTLKHLPHQDSAYVHGYSDFVQRGILPALGVDRDTL